MTARRRAVQFAVVREDPRVELEVLRRFRPARALLIASGGCTALTLATLHPELDLVLLDTNGAQLEHVRAKVAALARTDPVARARRFNVESDARGGLSECGNFEALFRSLREHLMAQLVPRERLEACFDAPDRARPFPRELFRQPAWGRAFELFFSDALLTRVFGPAAIQHAPPGSYPDYFRRAFERGLSAHDAADNPFLQHVFLGAYRHRPASCPAFVLDPAPAYRFTYVEGPLAAVDLAALDLVNLSNILDWMAPEEVQELFDQLRRQLRPGSVVLWRQLNNRRDLEADLGSAFAFDRPWQDALLARDRSLFYSGIHVGQRRT